MTKNNVDTSFQGIEEKIKTHLADYLPANDGHNFAEVINYAVFPTGKLFRPKLVHAIAKDLGNFTSDHEFLSSAVELHHTYTLIHDDLPAMDDDDYRRGRLSTHKKFNEWKAILAGDALMGISFQILANISSTKLPSILQLFGENTGAKGLILGQILDLAGENKSLEDLLKIHELKTARLIQLSIVGSKILANDDLPDKPFIDLGYGLGILFQLLDDLTELADEVGAHEKEINPFFHFEHNVLFNLINAKISDVDEVIQEYKLTEFSKMFCSYLNKIKLKVSTSKEKIASYIDEAILEDFL